MPKKRSLYDQLDLALQAMLAGSGVEQFDPSLAPLLAVAQDLPDLPPSSFKRRLKSEWERKAPRANAAAPGAARQTAAACLIIKNAAAAIEFYSNAFGAREIMRFVTDGKIGHAEIAIGNSIIMLADEHP